MLAEILPVGAVLTLCSCMCADTLFVCVLLLFMHRDERRRKAAAAAAAASTMPAAADPLAALKAANPALANLDAATAAALLQRQQILMQQQLLQQQAALQAQAVMRKATNSQSGVSDQVSTLLCPLTLLCLRAWWGYCGSVLLCQSLQLTQLQTRAIPPV